MANRCRATDLPRVASNEFGAKIFTRTCKSPYKTTLLRGVGIFRPIPQEFVYREFFREFSLLHDGSNMRFAKSFSCKCAITTARVGLFNLCSRMLNFVCNFVSVFLRIMARTSAPTGAHFSSPSRFEWNNEVFSTQISRRGLWRTYNRKEASQLQRNHIYRACQRQLRRDDTAAYIANSLLARRE